MRFDCAYLIFILIVPSRSDRSSIDDSRETISLSSVTGSSLIFQSNLIDFKSAKKISWYRGRTQLQPIAIIPNDVQKIPSKSSSHYRFLNETFLFIERTTRGDEGFYTLKLFITTARISNHLFHVLLFVFNPSLIISSGNITKNIYRAGDFVNITCSQQFFGDQHFVERIEKSFQSLWYMILYNNDPDIYQFLANGSNSFVYLGSLLNYELDRNDNQQIVSCRLIDHQSEAKILTNIVHTIKFDVQYRAFLRGNYHFTLSFYSQSSIDINCEEFDGNPSPVYSLLWTLNGITRLLLNRTQHGRYRITNATWRDRGNYTCLAENELNANRPVQQSFRLNVWFDEHRLANRTIILKSIDPEEIVEFRSSKKYIVFALILLVFVVACIAFGFSVFCFCVRFHQQ